ncbi:MAG: SDR family oxidoreductase [Dehalococcoidia bacterium]|jgi:NAD(P)-dependent dehydrogenase (short-subunit alcohol dehydrogenase family)|nr:SDR family oxidoreductase [Dehalococcoidia bacterium]
MGKLDGKVAIITGGGTGIGRGIADSFIAEGCSVVISGRRAEVLEKAKTELEADGGTVMAVQSDVTNEADIISLFEQTVERFGRLDILVNNAGVSVRGSIDETSLEDWQYIVSINLTGPFLCTREAMKIMKPQGGGRIINVGSISANVPRPDAVGYTSTKHGMTGLTKQTALEGREFGISCGQLNPGNTMSEIMAATQAREGADANPTVPVWTQGEAALYMATLPPEANVLEMTVMPVIQPYVGRG